MIDTPFNTNYLLTDENLPKLFALLESGDESNIALCLEMIIGSEPHPFLTGIACGIYLCSDNITLESRILEFLDNQHYIHVRNALQKLPYKISTNINACYNFLTTHEDIDYCGCAYVLWKYYAYNYGDSVFKINDAKPYRFTHIHFLKNSYLRFINVSVNNEVDDKAFSIILKDFTITRLYQTLKSDYFPKYLIQLPTLKHLFFENFNLSSPSILTIPFLPVNPSKNALYKIEFKSIQLTNVENIVVFQTIKALSFNTVTLQNSAFLSKMPQLTRLYFNNCGLVAFPSEIAVMRDLAYLHISNNKIKNIDFDFNIFQLLIVLSINESNLKKNQNTYDKWLIEHKK